MTTITRICRYPVKGLSAEDLYRVPLTVGRCLPHDRRFALARAETHFDPARPEWLPKTRFLMLMRDEKLASLRTRFDPETGRLTVQLDGQAVLDTELDTWAGREAVSDFLMAYLGSVLDGRPSVVEAPGHAFADASQKPNAATNQYVSIINLASIRALESAAQAPVDPIRFRANVYIEAPTAWEEFDWVGSELAIGSARLHVVSRITRCAATTVNPDSAERDLNIPKILQRSFGHVDMGIYAEVIAGGEIELGDSVAVFPRRAGLA